jgi:hypothetical protein
MGQELSLRWLSGVAAQGNTLAKRRMMQLVKVSASGGRELGVLRERKRA